MTNAQLTDLARLSARYGSDPLFTQGAGGNTSVKLDGRLFIKASGKRLSRALDEEIFVSLELKPLLAAIASHNELDFNAGISGALRGSIETPLHAVIRYPMVVHLHCVRTLAQAVRKNALAELEQKLSGLPWVWVPYAKPGWPLTWELEKSSSKDTSIWVLQNHGLIVAGNDCGAAESLLEVVTERLDMPVRSVPAGQTSAVLDTGQHKWRAPHDLRVNGLAYSDWVLHGGARGVLYPDQVVFLGDSIPVVDGVEQISSVTSGNAVIVKEQCVLVKEGASQSVDEMLLCLALVMERVPAGSELTYLTPQQVSELVDWDAEKYRQAMNSSAGSAV